MLEAQTPEEAVQGWVTAFHAKVDSSGGPMRVAPKTVRVLKKRTAADGELWYLTYEVESATASRRWRWLMRLWREATGRWRAHGIAGGSGEAVVRGRPWADLGGRWGPRGFCAGGTVEDAGAGIARVRLTDAEGRVFEDTVDGGIVLFRHDSAVSMPMCLDLLDADGHIVVSDEWGFVDR